MSQAVLTRHILKHYRLSFLVFSSTISHGFVTCGENYDGEEGGDKGPEVRDSPAGKDDAEVFGRPGEEHVHGAHGHVVAASMAHIAMVHVAVVHMGVGHNEKSGLRSVEAMKRIAPVLLDEIDEMKIYRSGQQMMLPLITCSHHDGDAVPSAFLSAPGSLPMCQNKL